MNKQVIENKLESLRRCIERVATKTPSSAAELANNLDTQDVIVLNLSRAVQLTVDVGSHMVSESKLPAPTSMRKVFDSLQGMQAISEAVSVRMKNAVGFRNVAVHCYDDLNIDIVFAICTQRLDDFKQFAEEVYEFLQVGKG